MAQRGTKTRRTVDGREDLIGGEMDGGAADATTKENGAHESRVEAGEEAPSSSALKSDQDGSHGGASTRAPDDGEGVGVDEEKGSPRMPATIRVPQDCATVAEAVARAVHGQRILIQAGEYQWNDRVHVDKVLHLEGEADKMTGNPATVLIGRWKLQPPDPKKWDMLPDVTSTFRNIRCESSGGYCVQVIGLHWEMINSAFYCKQGTAMHVLKGTLVLDGSAVGGSMDTRFANNGLVVCNDARAYLNKSAVRNCKNGIYLRDNAVLITSDSQVHRVSIAFGCMLPNCCEMEIAKTSFREVEEIWNENSRPEKLLQTRNCDIYGKAIYLHGDCDGSHTFQTQDLMGHTH